MVPLLVPVIIAIIAITVVVAGTTVYYRRMSQKKDQRQVCKDDDSNCILLNNLIIVASQKDSYVQLGKQILISSYNGVNRSDQHRASPLITDGLTFIVIKRTALLPVTTVTTFDLSDPETCPNMVSHMYNFVKNNIGNTDYVIVLSKGLTFNLLTKIAKRSPQYLKTLRDSLQLLGGMKNTDDSSVNKVPSFGEDSNYVLIGSKQKDVYFESTSNAPIFFPYIKLKEEECRDQTYAIVPPKEYIMFRDYLSLDEMRTRCALEAYRRDYTHFGIGTNVCLPMSDDEYENTFIKANKSVKCQEGVGAFDAISGYGFSGLTSTKDIYGDYITDLSKGSVKSNVKGPGVIVFTNQNFQGLSTVLNVGEYEEYLSGSGIDNINQIGSLIVPKDYVLYFVDEHKKTVIIYGPPKEDILKIPDILAYFKNNFKPIQLLITIVRDNQATFCENKDGTGRCFSFGVGSWTFPGYMFMSIKYVRLGSGINKVRMYSDALFLNMVTEVDRNVIGGTHLIEFPRIIRSVIVA